MPGTVNVPVEVLVRVKLDVSPGLRELLVETGWTPPPSGEAVETDERRINDEPHPRPPGKPLPPPSEDDDADDE
jgi:hypothetical protein